jgi:hypothetical protein
MQVQKTYRDGGAVEPGPGILAKLMEMFRRDPNMPNPRRQARMERKEERFQNRMDRQEQRQKMSDINKEFEAYLNHIYETKGPQAARAVMRAHRQAQGGFQDMPEVPDFLRGNK